MCHYQNSKCQECRDWIDEDYDILSYCHAATQSGQACGSSSNSAQSVTCWGLHPACNIERRRRSLEMAQRHTVEYTA